ncbi:MAG: hypothetical protein AB7U20_23460 [Planctomycetaceae bacterium]
MPRTEAFGESLTVAPILPDASGMLTAPDARLDTFEQENSSASTGPPDRYADSAVVRRDLDA